SAFDMLRVGRHASAGVAVQAVSNTYTRMERNRITSKSYHLALAPAGSHRSGPSRSEAGNTQCSGGGMGTLPIRSCQRNLLSTAVSTASARLKSNFLPSFHSFVLTLYSRPLSRLR